MEHRESADPSAHSTDTSVAVERPRRGRRRLRATEPNAQDEDYVPAAQLRQRSRAREAAAAGRQRKPEHVAELEVRVHLLETENRRLSLDLQRKQAHIDRLSRQLAAVQCQHSASLDSAPVLPAAAVAAAEGGAGAAAHAAGCMGGADGVVVQTGGGAQGTGGGSGSLQLLGAIGSPVTSPVTSPVGPVPLPLLSGRRTTRSASRGSKHSRHSSGSDAEPASEQRRPMLRVVRSGSLPIALVRSEHQAQQAEQQAAQQGEPALGEAAGSAGRSGMAGSEGGMGPVTMLRAGSIGLSDLTARFEGFSTDAAAGAVPASTALLEEPPAAGASWVQELEPALQGSAAEAEQQQRGRKRRGGAAGLRRASSVPAEGNKQGKSQSKRRGRPPKSAAAPATLPPDEPPIQHGPPPSFSPAAPSSPTYFSLPAPQQNGPLLCPWQGPPMQQGQLPWQASAMPMPRVLPSFAGTHSPFAATSMQLGGSPPAGSSRLGTQSQTQPASAPTQPAAAAQQQGPAAQRSLARPPLPPGAAGHSQAAGTLRPWGAAAAGGPRHVALACAEELGSPLGAFGTPPKPALRLPVSPPSGTGPESPSWPAGAALEGSGEQAPGQQQQEGPPLSHLLGAAGQVPGPGLDLDLEMASPFASPATPFASTAPQQSYFAPHMAAAEAAAGGSPFASMAEHLSGTQAMTAMFGEEGARGSLELELGGGYGTQEFGAARLLSAPAALEMDLGSMMM